MLGSTKTNYERLFTDPSRCLPFSTSFGGSSGFTQTNPFGSATQPSQPDLEISIFGASSQPAFGSTEAPAFCFGSTPITQTNPFGSATQPSQPAFEIRIFGSSTPPLSQPAFGSTEAPAVGATSTPAFGSTNPLKAIASTPVYKYKSDEELRWEAYQLGDKGFGQIPSFAPTYTVPFGTRPLLPPASEATNPFYTGLPLPTRFRFDPDDLYELTKDPLELYSHHFERSNTYRTEAIYCLR